MNRAIDSYQKCLKLCNCPSNRGSCVCNYVCQDKFRQDLGDYAMQTGDNTLYAGRTIQWPFMNPQLTPVKYIAVDDMDCEFKGFPKDGPFTTPARYLTGGCQGQQNRNYPYREVYRGGYGGLLKCTKPSVRDPIYY